jgi:CheY-like chemotaxis protein
VLLNLCLNARDAMPEGGRLSVVAQNAVIDASYALTQPAAMVGRYVLIEVTDTGCGIPPENIEKIFDPFFTTKALGADTGLGLATALGIVRSHGGFMKVDSKPAKGSTFKVYLPAQIEAPVEASGNGQEDKEWLRGNGEWILLVDDEASVLAITRQILEASGYHVLTAEHGAQAVGIFALNRTKVAAVITDLMMPVMDGMVTIAALRQIEPGVRIIAMSGLSSDCTNTNGRQAGVKHFLAKPYTAGTLLITLRKILSEEEI